MKKLILLVLMALLSACVAMAQTDELGAHNCYGRGCVACHAPHGGALGNGQTTSDTGNGTVALWGQNLSPFYSQTIAFASSSYSVTLPSSMAGVSISDTSSIVLLCLSCHDGSISTNSMMVGTTVETLPVVGGHAPTLFGTTVGNVSGKYYNEHPVGPSAMVSCGGSYNWDCTGGGSTLQPIEMTGTASAQFLKNNPASFWNGETITACGGTTGVTCKNPTGGTNTWGYNTSGNPLSTPTGGSTASAVTCTSCHNQHDEIVWSVGGKNYATMFFIRGYYQPATGGNNVAQFCRNCHGVPSNEMAGITNVPTT